MNLPIYVAPNYRKIILKDHLIFFTLFQAEKLFRIKCSIKDSFQQDRDKFLIQRSIERMAYKNQEMALHIGLRLLYLLGNSAIYFMKCNYLYIFMSCYNILNEC